jgi:hypothetical protein
VASASNAGVVGFQLTLPGKNAGGFCNMSPDRGKCDRPTSDPQVFAKQLTRVNPLEASRRG